MNAAKGIEIEISGSTTGLGKALKSVETQSKGLNNELRGINSLLKFDPKNTQLLTQKTDVLRKSIETSNDKLKTLKDTLAKCKAGTITATAEQMRDLEREIIKTEKDLKGFNTQLVAMGKTAKAELADTLNKAVKDSKTKCEDLTKALQKTDEALKLKPDSFELLKDKAGLLEDEVKATGEKLDALKAKLAAMKSGDIDATASDMRGLEREINQTKAALVAAKKASKEFGGALSQEVKVAGEKVKDLGQQVSDLGRTMAPVSAAAGAAVGGSVMAAANLEEAMSKVSALSGATGDDLAALEAKARDMGASTQYSATEAADAMGYMALAGWKTGDMMEGIEPILKLAAASQMELGETSDLVTDYLTAFGLSAQDAGHFADVLCYAQANSNTTTADLGEAYKNCAATAASMGVSMEDTTAILMTMANAGVKGGQAGTALNALMTRLATNTSECGTQLAAYGVSIYNTDGSMRDLSAILTDVSGVFGTLNDEQKAALAKTIAGTEHYADFQTVLAGLSDEAADAGSGFGDYAQALKDSDGAANDMYDTMTNNLNGSLAALKSALEEAAISLGQSLMPAIKGIVEGVQGLVDKFNGLPEPVKTAIAAGLVAIAALAPLLLGVGKFLVLIGQLMTFAPALTGAFGTIGKLFTGLGGGIAKIAGSLLGLGLPGLIIGAIIAIVAVLVTLYNTCEPFREFVDNLWQTIVGVVQSVWDWLVNLFTVTIPEAWDGFLAFLAGIPEAIGEFVQGVIDWFAALPGNIWDAICGAVDFVVQWVRDMKARADEGITNLIDSAIQFFTELPGNIWDAICGAIDGIKQWGSDMKDKAKDAAKGVFDAVVDGIKSIPDKMLEIGGNIVKGLWDGIHNMTDWVVGKIQGFGESVLGGIKDFFGIHSPSRVMRDQVGAMLPAGVGVGIEGNEDAALDPIDALGKDIIEHTKAYQVAASVDYMQSSRNRADALAASNRSADSGAGILARLASIEESMKNLQIVLDTGAVAGAVTDSVDRNLGKTRRKAVVYA